MGDISIDPTDVGLAIATGVGVFVCCVGVVVSVFLNARRRTRPRDDSTDSLV